MRFVPLLISLAVFCGCENRVSIDKLSNVASDIFDGSISVDANGVATVNSAVNVVGNEAHVTTLASGKKLVLFTTWQGKASNLRGYLFTNGPPLVVGSEIEVLASRPPHVSKLWIFVDSFAGKRAYAVSRSLD